MITHSRKRSFYNWVARLLTFVLMLSLACQISLANSNYSAYSTLLPTQEGQSVPIEQQTLSTSGYDANVAYGDYGEDSLWENLNDGVLVPDLDALSSSDPNAKKLGGYILYKIDRGTGETVPFQMSNTPAATDEFYQWTHGSYGSTNPSTNVSGNYVVYVKMDSTSTTTDQALRILGTSPVIIDSLLFNGNQAGVLCSSTDGATVYLKGKSVLESTAYGFDCQKDTTILAYDASASLTAIGSDGAGIRVPTTGSLTVNSGTVYGINKTAGSYNAGIGNGSAQCGDITVNGGIVIGYGRVGIGAGAVPSASKITINGGYVSAYGTVTGLGSYGYSSENGGGSVYVNGGVVYAYGGTYGIHTFNNGGTYLNGGLILAYTGSTESISVNHLKGDATGTLYATAGTTNRGNSVTDIVGEGAILFRNGTIPTANTSTWNMAVFNIADGQEDPYASYYSNGISVVDDQEEEAKIWYGRVYGDVQLKQNFSLEARGLPVFTYNSSGQSLDMDYTVLPSCDGMLLDIVPGTSFRHNTMDGTTGTENLLTIAEGSTLRFKGISEGTTSVKAPFLWSTSVYAPVGGGTVSVVLSSDLLGDGNKSSYTSIDPSVNNVAADNTTYLKLEDYTGVYQNKNVGYTTVQEAGRGNLWYRTGSHGPLSMSYRSSGGTSWGATTAVNADTYTVTLQGSGARYLYNTSSAKGQIANSNSGTDVVGWVSLEFLESGNSSFTIEPFNLTKNHADWTLGTTYASTFKVALDGNIASNIYITNGQLNLDATKYITVTSPFNTELVNDEDYVLSFLSVGSEYEQTVGDVTSTYQKIKIVIEGIGNYTGKYTDSAEIAIKVSDGSLGSVDIDISLDTTDGVASPIFVKPDGEADFSALIIKTVDGNTTLYDGKDPDSYSTLMSAKAVSVEGSLYYDITITVASGADLPFDQDGDDDGETLTFRVLANEAGTGSAFSDGQINLVNTMYQRPDGNLYPEDLVIQVGTSKKTLPMWGDDYTIAYYDETLVSDEHDGWVNWVYPVDCCDISGENCNDSDEEYEFQVKVTDNKTNKGDYIIFNATWKTGGSNTGNDFSMGNLYTYTATPGDGNKIYVAENYGVVLSADKLGLSASTYTVDVENEDKTEVENVLLSDSDFATVQNLAEFTAYEAMIEDNSLLFDYTKSYIFVYDNNTVEGDLIGSSLLLNERDSFRYFNDGTEFQDYSVQTTDTTWYLCLAGTGDFTGSIMFQIEPKDIVFLDILEDVVGILDDALILDPDIYPTVDGTTPPSSSKIYQKPDATLHDEDLKTLIYRHPTLTSHALTTHTVSTMNYQVAPETGYTKNDDGTLNYKLVLTGQENSQLINVYTKKVADSVDRTVQVAGTGTSFRHGYIDLVEEQTVTYVEATGTESLEDVNEVDGVATTQTCYTQEELEKIFAQLVITASNKSGDNKQLVYGTDFTATMENDPFDVEKEEKRQITLTSKTDSTDSVTFYISITMEGEASGQIFYYGNGENVTGLPSTSDEYLMSDSFAIDTQVPSRSGYTFKEWTFDQAGLSSLTDPLPSTFEELLTGASADGNDLALYAQWTENTYTITFNAVDGSFSGGQTTTTQGSLNQVITFPANPSKNGYAFVGWSETDGGTTAMAESTTYGKIATTTNDQTAYTGNLYAMWEELEPYHIYFDINYEGLGLMDNTIQVKSYEYDENEALGTLPVPSRTGYTFAGWHKETTCVNSITAENTFGDLTYDTITVGDKNIEKVAFLYAKWSEKTYSVVFDGNYDDETTVDPATQTGLTWLQAITLPTVTQEGYSFVGWLVEDTSTYATENMSISQLVANDSVLSVTLVAQWEEVAPEPDPTPTPPSDPTPTPPSDPTPTPPTTTPDSGNDDDDDDEEEGGTGGGSSSGGSSSGGSSSGGSSSGGSSSGGSSSTEDTEDATTEDKEPENTTVQTTLTPTVTDGTIQATILPVDMENAVEQGGELGDSYDILFTIPNSGALTSFEADWSKEVYTIFQDSNANSLSFQANGVIVTFDRDAVDYLSAQTASTGSILIEKATGTIPEAYGDRPVYDITMKTGTEVITGLDSGIMKISIPYVDRSGDNNLGGRTVALDVAYLNKSYYDGSYLHLLAETFGQFGIVKRDNTTVVSDHIDTWAEKFIKFMDARRLYAVEESFSMDQPMTRGSFVAILGELEGIGDSQYNGQFTDVDASSPYAPYIQWAYEQGIVFGKGNGRFDPDAEINREEMAVMLCEYLDYITLPLDYEESDTQFQDHDKISDWALDAVKTVQGYDLVHGYKDQYLPYDSTTFGEHAVMMMRLIQGMATSYTLGDI